MTRTIAFHLPQFHRIPENDRWWGEGFTEWTNVRRAAPRFAGHAAPDRPTELGWYDLTDPDTRAAQATLARDHGIDAFCYYHYWFHGQRLLERPFEAIRDSGEPDFPFLLCWANEPWTRGWSGDGEILMPQRYSAADDVAHLRALAPAFADPRYLRVDGRPVFLVYRASSLPDARATTDRWRLEADRLGVGELFLARVESFRSEHSDPVALGFDAAVEFQPDWRNVRPPLAATALRRAGARLGVVDHALPRATTVPYDAVVRAALDRPVSDHRRFPCVTPGWDNTPRRDRGAVVLTGETPERYEVWLRAARRDDPELLFVNAWNEWGEGAHLEPGSRWGRAHLEVHRRVAAGPAGARSPEVAA